MLDTETRNSTSNNSMSSPEGHFSSDTAITRSRVVIENISPQVDGGRFQVKRSVGETVQVEADVFVDGHDRIGVAIRHRRSSDTNTNPGGWYEVDMVPLNNDRWTGEFNVHSAGHHEFTVVAWVDQFSTWQYDLIKRIAAGQNIEIDLKIGAELVMDAAKTSNGDVARSLNEFVRLLRSSHSSDAMDAAVGKSLLLLMRQHGPRKFITVYPKPITLWVDRVKARFSSWYEFFPRSAAQEPGTHGTLQDVESRLKYVQRMGFDVLYLPPIHPIGRDYRKGRNNSPVAQPEDTGSPWAIGGPEGGHDAIHPKLGTISDFDRLIKSANECNIEIAMDLAFQCSPDHPYVAQHPEWFRHRPDGTIQYAENPPKKYQDIYPFDFECDQWEALWHELLRVTLHWVNHGVRIFRVDNPHTKPFPFWEWLISEVKKQEPSVLFLAEAFTRPKVMYRLAKLGFTQSYTYFAWRNEPRGIEKYYTELTTEPVIDFFRPNAWPNTPDILSEYLQTDSRAAYIVRAVLAATLCANYGIYGPAFELMDGRPVRPGAEEYLDSEKYQIRNWNLNQENSLVDLLTRLNQIRKEHPALQHDRGILFHKSFNDSVVCFSKTYGESIILVAVNTDPWHTQWAHLQLDLVAMGVNPDEPFQVHDLLTGARYRWQGYHATVGLDPATTPAHVFAVRRKARSEADFDYFV